jgi:hypothetical protein
MVRLLALLILGGCIAARGADVAPSEAQKIVYLIASIESLRDAQFIRNGSAYDAKTAADHLRSKFKTAGPRVKSASDFIRFCASVSSVSGKPYLIRFSDGRQVTSEAFLQDKLADYEAHAQPLRPMPEN